MLIKMDYGRQGLIINVPDWSDVFTVREVPVCDREIDAIQKSLQNPIQHAPLHTILRNGMRVLITHSDITRATPNDRLLPVIINEIEKWGINREDITLINGLGTHRPQTQVELISMLGAEIVERYHCVQHNAFDESQLVTIKSKNLEHPIRLNRLLFEVDLVILTGLIEPHFFAGFSGGPKAILPALAGAKSIYSNHRPALIAHPNATFNMTEGNPVWEEVKNAAQCVNNTFLVNVTLNRENRITGIFVGDVIAAHREGCQFVRESSFFSISEAYDLVITSNSGYPLDQNLYQCVKGMAAAKNAVRLGGAILLLAACEEGLPDYGCYGQLLKSAGSSEEILHMLSQPGYSGQDAWQVQIQALVQQHADIYIHSHGLDDAQIKASQLYPCRDLQQNIIKLINQYGPRVCVLPQGPHTILELSS